LTFKPNTDDVRDSPSLAIIPALQDNGALVRAYDPEGADAAKARLDNVIFAKSAYSCIEGADALLLLTEWDAFRGLDLDKVKELLKSPVVVDLRNVYSPAEMHRRGIAYVGVGR
jgi:UDPglucose 6-dehydrogenase